MITLSTASAVLRLCSVPTVTNFFCNNVDYIVYCFGGIETYPPSPQFLPYWITLSTASAVLRLKVSAF